VTFGEFRRASREAPGMNQVASITARSFCPRRAANHSVETIGSMKFTAKTASADRATPGIGVENLALVA